MRVLITGGAGFIGTHTAATLVRSGYKVRIIDLLDPQIHGANPNFPEWLPPNLELMRGDVCNEADVDRALQGVDVVLHLAARTGVGQSMYDLAQYAHTNVQGTAVLMERILKGKHKLHRFILSSSRAIYGEGLHSCGVHGDFHPEARSRQRMAAGEFDILCPQCGKPARAIPTTEVCTARPFSVYALTKLEQEAYVNICSEAYGVPVTVLRYFNVYGPRQSLVNPYTGIVAIFYARLNADAPISLYEGGLPLRDFVHVSDVADANLKAIDAPCGIYNVGSGEQITVRQLAEALGVACGRAPRFQDRGEFRVGDVRACYASLDQSRAGLGFEPRIGLSQGLADFASWASRQTAIDRYDQAVEELKHHKLFGSTERHAS